MLLGSADRRPVGMFFERRRDRLSAPFSREVIRGEHCLAFEWNLLILTANG
jgi:hypothetical protein